MSMMKKKQLPALISLVISQFAVAELAMLDDGEMSGISGQSGLSIDAAINMTIGEVAYFDDGNGIQLQGIQLGKASDITQKAMHKFTIDIEDDGMLNIGYDTELSRLKVSDIKLSDDAINGMGGFEWDYQLKGNLQILKGGAIDSNGYTYNSSYALTNGRFAYVTNGNSFALEGISMNVNAPGITMDVVAGGLDIRLPTYTGDYYVDAIRHNNSLQSMGSLWGTFDSSTNVLLRGGGRFGSEGISFDITHTNNGSNFAWGDDGFWLGALGVTGSYSLDNLTLDVAPDDTGRLGLLLQTDKLAGSFHIDKLVLNETKDRIDAYVANSSSPINSIGQFDVVYDFSDQAVGGVNYTNRVYLQGGGHSDAGAQGLRLNTEWSLNNASVTYTEDGNSVRFNGIKSWGKGVVTANVTKSEILGSTQFYDGLRIGFEGLKGGYKIDGLTVGNSNQKIDDQELQGGTELLLALGVYPAMDFEVDGHITLGAGGANGSGITVNSDVVIKGNAAFMVDENSRGIWATDLVYDMHNRNMTVDSTAEGLGIVYGESWSTMDIGNLRVGEKTGSSFGRFVFQRYEVGSSMTIKAGGAGGVCVGGDGNASSCTGEWEDRGAEGVTISLKNIFADAVDELKRNRFTWETNRKTDSFGNPENDTGMKLVFDNIRTGDGDGVNNTFGIQNDISVDVYQTKVVKKTTGVDSKGVFGNAGDEKIIDGSAPHGYRYVSAPSTADKQNRPLGFAVQAHTQFKELSVGQVDLVHPGAGGGAPTSSTIIYGMSLQNVNMTTNLTATPIQ